MLDTLNFSTIRTVVDVGANSGDLLLAIDKDSTKYLGFEPVMSEFAALQKNVRSGRYLNALQVALGKTNGRVSFFVSTAHGDSSVLEPANGFTEMQEVEMRTLDDVLAGFDDLFCEGIDLLKIEAEGYEPEVLQGAKETLKKCKFVTVDGGPERGKYAESTIEACITILLEQGFKLESINLESRPGVALFSKGLPQ